MSDQPKLSHLNESDQPLMVDVGDKVATMREATAGCLVELGAELISLMEEGEFRNKKGPVIHTAILAGIQATKLTSQLIPLCHPLPLDSAKVEITVANEAEMQVICRVHTTGKTGVEMEALTGASVAALTLYDMCKAANPGIIIRELKLLKKTGGKSDFQAS